VLELVGHGLVRDRQRTAHEGVAIERDAIARVMVRARASHLAGRDPDQPRLRGTAHDAHVERLRRQPHRRAVRARQPVGVAAQLRGAGATLLNQSVLLRGVNDSPDALVQLSERLSDCDVMPYYLHMLDPVRGTSHFDVPESEARALLRDAAARLPGYLVPRLVREEPGARSKTPLAW